MKRIILGLIVVTLFGCSKEIIKPIPLDVPVVNNVNLPKILYYSKTSYELKNSSINYLNVDSLRAILHIANIGKSNGTNNLGYVYVDMNNDGREDIFYPYTTNGGLSKPAVLLNYGNYYENDNSMLPTDYVGNENTRKTLVGDYNNDSLPDLFLINQGYEDPTTGRFNKEANTLLLSNKVTHKYELGILPNIGIDFWHGGASGDLNNDGNIDIVVSAGLKSVLLIGDGKGNFTANTLKDLTNGAHMTIEIVDVNKDGQNDIIMTGDEGIDNPPAYLSYSKIYFNNNGSFDNQLIMCDVNSDWRIVEDIACEDIDGDGINEIILDRQTSFGSAKLSFYKFVNGYTKMKDVTTTFINNDIISLTHSGGWCPRMNLIKTNNRVMIRTDVTPSDLSQSYTIKYLTQNPTTKLFQ